MPKSFVLDGERCPHCGSVPCGPFDVVGTDCLPTALLCNHCLKLSIIRPGPPATLRRPRPEELFEIWMRPGADAVDRLIRHLSRERRRACPSK